MGGQPIEVLGEADERIACVVKPHLSRQIPQTGTSLPDKARSD
jgi:hypothetical protein